MPKFDHIKAAGLALLLTAGLAGCSTDGPEVDDVYSSTSTAERYPIKVAKGPVNLGVAARRGGLRPNQVDTVVSFAQAAASNSYSSITVSRPSGGGRSQEVAGAITQLLVRQGIPAGSIVHSVYRGPSTGPVNISYIRTYAVTKPCGDWSEDLANDTSNQLPPNFGCAMQQNIAAMVADPEDFARPQGMGNAMARRRIKTLNDYTQQQSGANTMQSVSISSAIN
jgi:pilus assembly protein CpaD